MIPSVAAFLWLWIPLAFPSVFIVHKYLGWQGTVVYGLLVVPGIFLVPRLLNRISSQKIFQLAVATFAGVAILFILIYPITNTQIPGRGSDDDDSYNLGAGAMMTGRSPYTRITYLGNVLHALPGSYLLAAPFVLIGTSALQNLFWLTMFFVAVKEEIKDRRTALQLAWLVLALSPTVLHQVVTGTGHVSNTIYVLLGMWWLMRTTHRDIAAIGWGVALASRANFLFLVPLAFGWLTQHLGWRVAVRATTFVMLTAASLTIPFYLHDPANFGPLEASDRLLRFDTLFPHLGAAVVIVMGLLALGLSLTPMNDTALFRNCAIVQAVPVAAGLGLSLLQDGKPDLLYAAYGTFFAWFMLMATAARTRVTSEPNANLVLSTPRMNK